MMKFERILREFIDSAYNDTVDIRSYSGRGMYGKTCLSVTIDNAVGFVAEFAFYIGHEAGICDEEQHYSEDFENCVDCLKILKNSQTDNTFDYSVLAECQIYWQYR